MKLQTLKNSLLTINKDFIDFNIDHLLITTNKLSKNQSAEIYEFLVGFYTVISNNKTYLKVINFNEIYDYTYKLSK